MKVPIPGIDVSLTEEVLWISSQYPLAAIASTPVGGGLSDTRQILNAHVDKDYNQPDPASDLFALARRLAITDAFIGMMTAVHIHQARAATVHHKGLTVFTIATVGLSNAYTAGITGPVHSSTSGTINLITLIDANLSPAALVNAVITTTEAKCDLLRRIDRRTLDGEIATGTSTDAVVIATTGNGVSMPYAGPATEIGWLIARSVRKAMEAALR